MAVKTRRRLPVGAEVVPGAGVHFRVWAPRRSKVEVVIEDERRNGTRPSSRSFELAPESSTASRGTPTLAAPGYFSAMVPDSRPGDLYRYRLDGEAPLYPDPASRFQPEGPHGPSQVVDPDAFTWTDHDWKGLRLEGQVIYEIHVGTFTQEGTWEAASRELPELASLGITAMEVMPVADFPGNFGWGYDGVDLYAPTRLYGGPEDFRRFIDRAHAEGLAVILDVVYNHPGPDGNYLRAFSHDYFTDRRTNEWGEAVNFDGQSAGPVREFFVANAAYWIQEYHLDGLRLDATQTIYDDSPEHVLKQIVRRAREAAGGRSILLIAENESQQASLARTSADRGYDFDAVWNDDFHHTAMVALTGRDEAYYTDYRGTPQELISSVKWGYLYQGQHYRWQRKRRGSPTFDLKPAAFVTFLQNHDQVANSAFGLRFHQLGAPGRYRAMTALLLLAPSTPMLFQGQEFAASTPFLYFADHEPKLSDLVKRGRRDFLAQFPSIASDEIRALLADPADPSTFRRSKLQVSERDSHPEAYALHRDLLRLRRDDPVFRGQRPHGVDGAVLAEEALVLRFFGEDGSDRLLVLNLGRALELNPAPEPLLAPPSGMRWETCWSSEHPRYGGQGSAALETDDGRWCISGHLAAVLRPVPRHHVPSRLDQPLPEA